MINYWTLGLRGAFDSDHHSKFEGAPAPASSDTVVSAASNKELAGVEASQYQTRGFVELYGGVSGGLGALLPRMRTARRIR